jgi:hypothetical protein
MNPILESAHAIRECIVAVGIEIPSPPGVHDVTKGTLLIETLTYFEYMFNAHAHTTQALAEDFPIHSVGRWS